MDYYHEPGLLIRSMTEHDISALSDAFASFDRTKSKELFQCYYSQQTDGERIVLIADYQDAFAGYITLVPSAKEGPFKDKKVPEIKDFNVLPTLRRKGIGWKLMDAVEQCAKKQCPIVSLGVGLYRDYGSAQRMYIKRGYMPDGTGLWYGDEQVSPGHSVFVDDDLVLYLLKVL